MLSPEEEPSDETLVRRYEGGDLDAFLELTRRYGPSLALLARGAGRDRRSADAVVEQVFVALAEQPVAAIEGDRIGIGLYKMARAILAESGARAKSPTARSGTTFARVGVEGGLTPPARSEEQALLDAIDALPDEQREVLVMREAQRLSFAEIAEIVGEPEATVRDRARFALERLHRALVPVGGTASRPSGMDVGEVGCQERGERRRAT